MGKLVVIRIGEGNFELGFPVTLDIGEEGANFHTSLPGQLPASPIDSLYEKWQSEYRKKVSGRMIAPPAQVANCSDSDLIKSSNLLKEELNNWINSKTFSPIKDKFQQKLKTDDTVRVIIQTENPRLRRLPWYLWDLFDSYRFAEVALSLSEVERVDKSVKPKPKVRILAILGDSSPDPRTGIRLNINADKQFWESLPDAETVFLGDEDEPNREKFNEQLWDENGWDILFFAGHSSSQSDATTGEMYINSKESLTIPELKYALQKAIERGLQLAIFNSCDGLGIARDLAELQIPQIIVMREPVPDGVAQNFLKYFLSSFSSGKTLYLSVREARERLHGLENYFPCASWLPVICQNPAENPVTWQGLRGIEAGINWREVYQNASAERQRLTTNPLTTGDGVEFTFDDIYVPLGLVEKVKKEKRPGEVSPEEGSQFYQPEKEYEEVTRTYKNDEFFAQVLKQGQSPKSQGRRLAVTGEPGAGKTTLLQKIAQWVAAETEQDVAIWVSFADLQGRSVEEYLLQRWLKDALGAVRVTPEMEEALALLFNNGRVWLLLDGVDEMGSGNPLATVANQISGWVASARVVVTCRQNVWDAGKNALEGFDVYRNLDFDYPEGVGQFIHRWFARHPELGERLLAELAQAGKERIRDTVRNPLRLALLCRAWQIRQGGLPETKAGLYGQFAKALYEWKQEKFPTTAKERKDLNAGLGRLALRGMEQSESRFRLREGLVTEVLGETDEPLCQLALQLGWLNLVGVAVENPDERVYAFYHPTFQEYFAALAVDDWGYFLHHVPDNPSLGTYRIFEKQWKEVILLWFGRENVQKEKKEAFIENLVNFDDGCGSWNYPQVDRGFYEYRAYFLAAAVINEFQECSLCDAIVEQIIKWGFGYFSREQEWLSFFDPIANDSRTVLRETIREKATANLIELLENTKDKSTRFHVVIILEEITELGNELAIRQLIQLLRATNYEDIHSLIASILEKITVGNELAIRHLIGELIRVLETTNNQKNRRISAFILGKIAPQNQLVIVALIRVLETANNKWECDNIASSLEKIAVGNELAIRQLIRVLKITINKYIIKTTICSILGKIAIGNKLAIAELVRLLKTTDNKYTCSSVLSTLGEIAVGNELAIMALIRFLETTEDEDTEFIWLDDDNWLLNTASGLGKIAVGNELAIMALIRVLETTTNEDIFNTICSILGKIAVGNSSAIKALVRLFKTTEYEDARRKYASILGKIAVDNELVINELINELVRLLETTEEDNREKVASILGEIAVGNELVIQVLIRVLETTDNQNYRWSFAHCLEKIAVGNELAILTLIQALKINKYPDQCWIFCCILKKITVENELGIQELIQILETIKNDEFKIRYVVEILGEIAIQKNELAIAELVRLLETTDNEDTCRNVASVLGEIAPKNHKLAIRALIRVLETTDDEDTCRNVAYNLGGIAPGNNNELAIRALIRVLETTDDEDTRTNFAFRLCLIAPENELAIRELIQVLETTDDDRCRDFIVWKLGEINPVNELTIRALIRVLETNKDKDTRVLAASSLEKIAVGNELAIRGLIRILETGDDEDVLLSIKYDQEAEKIYYINTRLVANIFEKIAVGNKLAIIELIRLLQSLFNKSTCDIIASTLGKIAVGNKLAIIEFLRLLKTSDVQRHSNVSMLEKMVKIEEQYIDVVTTINCNLFRSLFFQECYALLWQCAENLPYPKFYQAWHHQLTSTHPEATDNIPVGNTLLTQSLETQINDILTQLQPTTQTYPLPINIQSLADETDTSAICQEICTLIYSLALPDTDIPTASNFAQLKQQILTLKKQLQKRHLALILHECTPHPPLLTCCRKIADANLGLHVVWITDEPLEAPLRSFLPSQDNLLGVIQTWLEEF